VSPAPSDGPTGGSFLIAAPGRTFAPEDLSDEARAIARTIDEFWARDVAPALPALDRHEPAAARALLRKSAGLGLTSMQVPADLGGVALDLPSVILATEHLAEDPSYFGWHHGHAGLGTLPLVYYGTAAQQRQYLPRLLSVDLMGAYALTEPHAGSDALAARTRADLVADGRAYTLNGQKAWITNGAEADLFTVFAKVGGEHFTAFLVERAFGVRSGAEERKMGLQGTSTTPVYFDNVRVPVENVLGEIGRGHIVALNILNDGRLKIGPLTLRGARKVLRTSLAYARERRAFGSPIASFGAIRQKLAAMAVRIFAAESVVWRAVGLIDEVTRQSDGVRPPHVREIAAFEEFAIECAIVKVFTSEMLDVVTDEGVQIHGGSGFHRDAYVERAFRDARVNRIFEGTNEINRLVIVSQLIKRAERNRLPLFEPAAGRMRPSAAAWRRPGPLGAERALVDRARGLARDLVGLLRDRVSIAGEQDLMLLLADIVIEVFAMEAVVLRAARPDLHSNLSAALAASYVQESVARVERAALTIVTDVPDGALAARARALGRRNSGNAIALQRQIAGALVAGDGP
jgi:alkylation response protein AidB-like acyl-CoA dehydrogenase